MIHDDFDELLRDAASTYNTPPEPPRDAMWRAIARARDAAAVVQIRPARRTPRWLATGAAAAAVLLLGVAIGRFTRSPARPELLVASAPQAAPQAAPQVAAGSLNLRPPPPFRAGSLPNPSVGTRVASANRSGDERRRTAAAAAERGARLDRAADASDRATEAMSYRFAVVEHLTRAEVLLTGFRAQARPVDGPQLDAQFTILARDLLGTTRLLLATRRTDDAPITRLLEDLELVLMQLSQYAKDGRRIDLDAINQSLDKRNVLPKLRSNIPAGVSASAGT